MMPSLSLLGLPLVAALLAYALAPLAGRLAVCIGAVDLPGPRKVHDHPIPRLGGVSVILATGVTWALGSLLLGQWDLPPELVFGLIAGLIPIATVSILDDIRPLNSGLKFLGHLSGAVIAVGSGLSIGANVSLLGVAIPIGILAWPLSVAWIVGLTNAFNLIDGLDGLSAGLALIASATLGAVFLFMGQPAMAGSTLVLAGALAGFLPYNVHPARLFLGDTGATAIGFTLAIFALRGGFTVSSGFAVLIPVFIMGLPIADTLVAIARRSIMGLERRGAGIFTPDSNHIHHRLIALGLDHRRAVLILYGVGVLSAGAALASMFLNTREAALFAMAVLMAGLIGVRRLGYDEFALIRRGVVLKAFDFPVVRRSMFAVFSDIAVTVLAALLAVGLKTDAWTFGAVGPPTILLASTMAPLTIAVFWLSGLYRGSWRLAGISDLLHAAKAIIGTTLVGFLIYPVLWSGASSPTLVVIYGLVSFVIFTGSRASYVVLLSLQRKASLRGAPALVYGAGSRGFTAVDALYRDGTLGFRPIGFIDDDRSRNGRSVNGLPVLGPARDLETIMRDTGAKALLVATSKIRPDRLQHATEICRRVGAGLFRARTLVERIGGGHPQEEEIPPRTEPPALPAVPAHLPQVRREPVPVSQAMAGLSCANCGADKVFRSRTRSLVDRGHKLLTEKRPYRCHECGWRGWTEPIEEAARVSILTFEPQKPDLALVDQVIRSQVFRKPSLRL